MSPARPRFSFAKAARTGCRTCWLTRPPKLPASVGVCALANSAPEGRRTLVYATVLYWQTRELSLLRRCLDSLLGQNLGNTCELRIILIDNGCGATPSLPVNTPVELI